MSTLTCVVAAIVGQHFGHVLRATRDHVERLRQMGAASLGGIAGGLILHFAGMPLNTDLYSVSFLLLTCGASGLMLCLVYCMVDVQGNGLWSAGTALRV